MSDQSKILVRPAQSGDAPHLCELLNQLIRRGGTTAHQKELSLEEFSQKFLESPTLLSCHVACLEDGSRLGFQHLQINPKLPEDWGDIATFAKLDSPVRGVGTALFPYTLEAAKAHKRAAINATIRADNASGLGYYSKMGFADYAIAEAVPLTDGTPVDRISKKYVLK